MTHRTLSLPEAVRFRVVALAAGALPAVPADELPSSLRRFVKFTPSRRAKLAAIPLAASLATDDTFRERVAEVVLAEAGDLGEAIRAGTPVPTADPVDVAALSFLVQAPDWEQLVAVLAPAPAKPTETVDRESAERARAAAKLEIDKLRGQLASLREANERMSQELKETTRQLREAQRNAAKARNDLSAAQGRAAIAAKEDSAALRRMAAQLTVATAAADAAKASQKISRDADSARLAVLLGAIRDAADGLVDELGLASGEITAPADVVAAAYRTQSAPHRVAAADEVMRLDQLLRIPRVHVIVDGYNVTKTGYPELPLERQRQRLINSLGGLHAQTGAEITVVFDGTERLRALLRAPRGVRVIFSHGDQIADEVITTLLGAEPSGRGVVVVSSDKEVMRAAQAAGKYAVPSGALVTRLERG